MRWSSAEELSPTARATLFRVLMVDDEHVWMLKIRPKSPKNVMHTRTLTWEQYQRFGYDLKFP